MEIENFRSHITLKDGTKVRFIPPPPNGDRLGGITQEERESLTQLKGDLDEVKTALVGVDAAADALMEVVGVDDQG